MNLLSQNRKIKKSSGSDVSVFNFGIPAYQSATGLRTCPLAGQCAKGCYAQAGAYRWSNVSKAYEDRLTATTFDEFVDVMTATIRTKLRTATRQKKQLVIRIHDSGDFYSASYLVKWLRIIELNPEVKFYAYTKQIPMFKRIMSKLPVNFTVIFSEGGKADRLIDAKKDRHARVFATEAELAEAGYANAMENDLVAMGENPRIGLLYHGAKANTWTTGE